MLVVESVAWRKGVKDTTKVLGLKTGSIYCDGVVLIISYALDNPLLSPVSLVYYCTHSIDEWTESFKT